MLNKIKLFLVSLVAVVMPAATIAAPAAIAQSTPSGGGTTQNTVRDNLCQGASLEFNSSGAQCNTQEAETQVNDIVKTIINIFSWVIGVVAVIMIIYAGFRYITSGGDQGGVKSAKDTILYAIIGLVVVVLAQTIVRFVLGTV